jgi:hypothetical protein
MIDPSSSLSSRESLTSPSVRRSSTSLRAFSKVALIVCFALLRDELEYGELRRREVTARLGHLL